MCLTIQVLMGYVVMYTSQGGPAPTKANIWIILVKTFTEILVFRAGKMIHNNKLEINIHFGM